MNESLLERDEADLADAVRRGDMADFTRRAVSVPPTIRAATIRRLLTAALPSVGDCPLRGVRLAGATIVGELDLEDLMAAGAAPLPPLVVHHCSFGGPLKIAGARLSRLELVDCQLAHLDGRNVLVDGSIVLRRLRSNEHNSPTGATAQGDWAGPRGGGAGRSSEKVPTSQGRCEINLRGARIAGDLKLDDCVLVADRERPDFKPGDAPPVYALNSCAARIGGNFEFAGSAALGGIGLNGATVKGNLWLAGSKLVAGEDHAFDGQLMRVEGFAGMRAIDDGTNGRLRFECQGTIYLLQATIGSSLDLSGALLWATRRVWTLVAYNADIGDRLMMQASKATGHRFESYGLIHLGNVRIGGEWNCVDSDLRPAAFSPGRTLTLIRSSPGPTTVLDATGANVSADVSLAADAYGDILLSRANVDGDLAFGVVGGAALRLHTSPEPRQVLSLAGTTVRKVFAVNQLAVIVSDGLDELRRLAGAGKIERARTIETSWFSGWRIAEVLCQTSRGPAITALLSSSDTASLLYRTGTGILPFVQKFELQLSTVEAAADYLRFFCPHVWAAAGGFYIVEPGSTCYAALPDALRARVTALEVTGEGDTFSARATVQHERSLYSTVFKITRSGNVTMAEDTEIGAGAPEQAHHDFPFKRPAGDVLPEPGQWFSEPGTPGPWIDVAPAAVLDSLRTAVSSLPDTFRARPVIALAGATIGELKDRDGNGWPASVRLDLEGLTLSRIRSVDRSPALRRGLAMRVSGLADLKTAWWSHPIGTAAGLMLVAVLGIVLAPFAAIWWMVQQLRARAVLLASRSKRLQARTEESDIVWRARARWLRLQYERYVPTRPEFHPQPYEMLAAVYRQQGLFEDSRRITILKLDAYRRTKAVLVARPFLWLYRLTFGYGLSITRALATFLLSWWIGYAGVTWAHQHGVLVLNVTPDHLAEHTGPQPPCGDQISPPLYALDLFLPLLDLRQEERCAVRTDPIPTRLDVLGAGFASETHLTPERLLSQAIEGMRAWRKGSRGFLHDLRFWRYAKAGYAFLGWIVSSLTILTLTGVLRRQAES